MIEEVVAGDVGARIRVKNVTKVYGSGGDSQTVALANVDLEIEPGSITCIIGKSGCGKSTLLNVIAGFERLTSGEVTSDGVPITGPGVDRIVVFQDVAGSLMPWLTVGKNVEFGMKIAGVPGAERSARAEVCLEQVGLGGIGDKHVWELSGGMQQRVQIARGLALHPNVLLMDEPFGALDYLTRSKMHTQLQELHRKTKSTIIFVTHDISEATTLGDRVVVMGAGGRLQSVVDIDVPRPRSMTSPALAQTADHLMNLILDDKPELDETTLQQHQVGG